MKKHAVLEGGTRIALPTSSPPFLALLPILTHQIRTPTLSERTGEGRLMRAVLDDAIASFCRYRSGRKVREQRLFELERSWFARDDAPQPFAFATVCNALGLDRASLRRILQVWESEAASSGPPGAAHGQRGERGRA